MKKKHFKSRHALLMSLTSLTLCVSMLFGATFAWFTDSVTSGVNRIVSGNLDVELYHSKAVTVAEDTDNKVEGATNLFTDKDGNAMKWEPGAVAYENFLVKNAGSLALKYNMALNIAGFNYVTGTDKFDLRTPLKVKVLTGTGMLDTVDRSTVLALDWNTSDTLASFRKEGGTLYPAGGTDANTEQFQVIVYWEPTANDNNWNVNNDKTTNDGKDLYIDFGVSLAATQLEHESDSFGNDYDAAANLPALSVAASAVMTTTYAPGSTESLEITKSGAIESASVPAAAANSVFNSFGLGTEAGTSNELTMNLNVEKTGETNTATSTTVALQIDMTAVMKTTPAGGEATTTEKNVTSLTDYVTINYNLGANKNVSGVTHNENAMGQLTSATAVLPATGDSNYNENGYYYYDAGTGILTIKTKSFSPFAVTFAKNTGHTATITQPQKTWLKDGKYVLPYGKKTHPGASLYTTTATSAEEFNSYYNAALAFVNEMEQYFTPNEDTRTITIDSVEGLKLLYKVDEYCSAKNAVACKDMTGGAAGTWYYATLHEPDREFIVVVDRDLNLDGSIDANGNIVNNWTPTECSLDIDFGGHTVSNLVSDTYVSGYCGLFCTCSEVKNLVLENVTILGLTGNKQTGAGAIAGAAEGTLINCTVKNAKITTSKWAGAFAAFSYGSIENCTAENVEVTCGYKLGGLCGQSSTGKGSTLKYSNNQLINVKLVCDLSLSGKTSANIGKLMGYLQNNANIYGNTFVDMVVTPTGSEQDVLIGVVESGFNVTYPSETT